MSLRTAKHSYLTCQQQFRRGQITEDEFRSRVEAIKITASDGTIWRIAEDGAGWLMWNGTEWTKSRQAMAGDPSSCRTLFELLSLMVRGMVRRLPLIGVKLGIVAGLVWVVNVYLSMRYNIPWWGATSEFFRNLLGAGGHPVWRWLFWMLLSSTVMLIVTGIKADRLRGVLAGLSGLPDSITRWYESAGANVWPLLLAGTACSLLIGTLADIRLLGLVMSLLVLLALARWPTGTLYLVSRLVWSDVRRLLQRKPEDLNDGLAAIVYAGFIIGGIIAVLLADVPVVGYVTALAAVLAAMVLAVMNHQTRSHTSG